MKDESRTNAQLREHYEIEKQLASRLRNASPQERRRLYAAVYNELFQRVPHHPQLKTKFSPDNSRAEVSAQMTILKRYVSGEIDFLEVGPGDCGLSIEMSKFVSHVYALDVSDEITRGLVSPENVQLILFDGCSIPLPNCSVHLAYSHQLIEHLHPDDALDQLRSIYDVLIPGGTYVCITKSRLTGPHDISEHFDRVATGFHLKEYTVSDLTELFKDVGFSKIAVHFGAREKSPAVPAFVPMLCERFLWKLPHAARKSVVGRAPLRPLLEYIILAGKKPVTRQ